MANILERRAQASPKVAASGLIINTLGWIDGLGYELQIHAISSLKADVVIVMEQDRLYSQLAHELKRERDERRGARDRRIKEYFYGPRENLVPTSNTVRSDQLMVWRIGGGARAPNSALPIGAMSVSDPLRLSNLPANAELVESLMAVSHATTPDQILSTNVAGFMLVKDVDATKGMVTYMSPCPGALPGRYMITGSLRSTID
eukprot:gene7449-589_t